MKNIDINPAKKLGDSWVSTSGEGTEPEVSSIFCLMWRKGTHLVLFLSVKQNHLTWKASYRFSVNVGIPEVAVLTMASLADRVSLFVGLRLSHEKSLPGRKNLVRMVKTQARRDL